MSDAIEETLEEGQGQRRIILVVALLVMFGSLGFVSFGHLGENLVYYWDCSQVVEAGEDAYGATIRLGGVVKEGSLDWDENSNELNFQVTDGKTILDVHATGAPPQMFREGIGVVVEGTMVKATGAGRFESDRFIPPAIPENAPNTEAASAMSTIDRPKIEIPNSPIIAPPLFCIIQQRLYPLLGPYIHSSASPSNDLIQIGRPLWP